MLLAVATLFSSCLTCRSCSVCYLLCAALQRRKKLGLLAAVDNLSSELMLLSVATLLLTALAPAITTICMPQGNTYKPWLSNVKGCACCLAKTKGVTPCFMQVRAALPHCLGSIHRLNFAALAACCAVPITMVQLQLNVLTTLALATTIFMPQGNTYKPWLSNVRGCVCCLAKTKGVTPCFMQVREG